MIGRAVGSPQAAIRPPFDPFGRRWLERKGRARRAEQRAFRYSGRGVIGSNKRAQQFDALCADVPIVPTRNQTMPLRVIQVSAPRRTGRKSEDQIMRIIAKTVIAFGFVGAIVLSAPSATRPQGTYFEGPGLAS